ncbi:MAG: TonB-dependent receptor [Sphingobacteriales bacterium]|nr:MAG: TonB-dependent receptor [Sphingobacteriales bacterium]
MAIRLISILFVMFFGIEKIYAASIKGTVKDKAGIAMPGVNVVVLKDDGQTLVKADIANDDGNFLIDGIADGGYILKATFAGYEVYTSEKIQVQSKDVQLPVIVLETKSTTLKEVSVKAQKPFVEVKPDRIVVNVENSIVSAGSSVLEVLARSPGVKVDQNDNISLKGKPGVTIMIDGKITAVSGDELANILKSMPASTVDKIELISNPGAKYDAAGTAGIINIKTKKDQRVGWNGSANLTYTQVYPKYNAGINLNYRNKKLNLYGNYSYADRYWFNHLMLNRRFYSPTGSLQFVYDQNNYSLFDFKNHVAGLGADYSISKNTTVGVSVNGGVNKFNPKADNDSRALGPDLETIYNFKTTGRHKNMYDNLATNIYLRHSFDTAGKELSVDIDYAGYGSSSNQNFVTNYTNTEGGQYMPDYYMKSNMDGLTQIRSLKADYSNPLPGKAKLDAGVKLSYVTSDNKPLFYQRTTGEYVLDTTRSNHFIYRENINAAYLNLDKDWTKWSTQLGLRMENTNVEAKQITLDKTYDRNYTQLFPSLAVQRHLNEKNDIGLTLSRRIEGPNYDQLNPFKFFIDKTTYKEGYPYLNPASSYSVELSHTFKQKFVTTLTYSVTSNVLTEVIQPSETEDSVTVQTTKNLKRMSFYGISGAYPFQVTKWWSNMTNLNVYYAYYEGFIANTNLRNGAPTFDIYTTNSFILPKDFSAEVSLFYQAPQVYGFMTVQQNWMLNAGLQKNILNKKATLKINVQDIFWRGYPTGTSTYTGYIEDFTAKRDTRQASVSFTYRFGNKAIGQARERSGGAEDEKRRAGGS